MIASEIFNEALASIRAAADIEDWPNLPDFSRGVPPGTVMQTYDELAALLATKYAAGQLSFDEGDHLANEWWGMMIATTNEGWSDLLYEVYDAFDAGEWSHSGEWFSKQPVKDYTDPAIEKIVARL